MRYQIDQCGNRIADHGLGAHAVGISVMPAAVTAVQPPPRDPNIVTPVPPCPPPGYPNHTQWNGTSCCVPQACVPQAAPTAQAQVPPTRPSWDAWFACIATCRAQADPGACARKCGTPTFNV